MEKILNENIYCPICRDLFIKPRIYECGHTVCEECMKNIDETDKKKYNSVFDVVHYTCPLCRFETITKCSDRPINHSLKQILEKLPEYKKKVKNSNIDINEDIQDNSYLKCLNFSNISFKHKFMKAEEYYHKLLPVLYDAAIEGKNKLLITKNIKDLSIISSLLAKKLWKHGILNIVSTPREFIIYLLPENDGHSNEFINPSYNLESSEIDNYSNEDDILVEEEYNNLINSYITNSNRSQRDILNRYNY